MSTIPFPAAAANASSLKPLLPVEGLQVLHLYYTVDHGLWQSLGDGERNAAKGRFLELVQSIRSHPRTQLLTMSIVTPKADIGFMLLTPDLHDANAFEKQLTLALAPTFSSPPTATTQ